MIVVVEQNNLPSHTGLVDLMHRLRARVFGEKLKWDVTIDAGRERDRYDDLAPVYLIDTDREMSEVRGSLRLLPTTGPTVLGDFFADTMPDAAWLSAPTIWECTRFCVDEQIVGKSRREQMVASGALIAGLGEVAMRSGIESILGNFDASMLRLYRRIGCEVEVLGATHRYGEPVYLGLFPVSGPILEQVKSRLPESAPRSARRASTPDKVAA
jgi:acyl homoserine lactone synthase